MERSTSRGHAALNTVLDEALAAGDEELRGADPLGRVLLADDCADLREHVCGLLAPRYAVEAVSDGVAALAAARSQPPDLVLSDVRTPLLDGFGLLRALRDDPRTRLVPVVLLSARAGEEARIEGLEAGADYLLKPFTARELVARVRTHVELARLRRHAVEEQGRFKAAFTHAMVGMGMCDLEGRFIGANPALLAITGYTEAELCGCHMEDLTHPDDRSRTRELLHKIVGGQIPSFVIEKRYLRRDGRSVWVEAGVSLVRDEKGRALHLLGIVDQIDARKEAEAERRDALERERAARAEAEAANRAKDEFLAMLGHELRNPLAPIQTALELMRMHGAGEERERAVIERQLAYVVRLVDDLLDVSRITRGKIRLKRARVELGKVVQKAIEMASPLIEQRRHSLRVVVRRRGLLVEGDEDRLAQVAANLLTNAAKYTDTGGAIVVEGTREGGEVVLRVRDNGIGLGPELVPRLFDLFQQGPLPPERGQGGLGLGLAIVRSLVELHGGRVDARSDGPGQGSEFTVRLPACPAERARDAREEGAADESALGSTHRVLVVDDNTDAAELLAEVVSEAGYVARAAFDGPSALALAESMKPDVALLDLGLPVMDGVELGRRLRQLPGLSGLRLIAVTGYGQDSDRARTRAAGFEAHLRKPIELATVTALLERVPPPER